MNQDKSLNLEQLGGQVSEASNTPENVEAVADWKTYELDRQMLPSFMSKLIIKKIFFIGNGIRLLRNMIKQEYDNKMLYEILHQSSIQINYDLIKKFLYNNVETSSGSGNGGDDAGGSNNFYFEHPLVDDFDQLLDSYYEVINVEMFKILNLNELYQQFQVNGWQCLFGSSQNQVPFADSSSLRTHAARRLLRKSVRISSTAAATSSLGGDSHCARFVHQFVAHLHHVHDEHATYGNESTLQN